MIGIYIRIAAIVAGIMALALVYHTVKNMGRHEERLERAAEARRKLNDATLADTAVTRCLADPACRLRDDGFRRD